MSLNKKVIIFSWRQAIQESPLEPMCKLVLMNLSCYMNERGESCYPSIVEQCRTTGIKSKGTVIKHLKKAAEKGFLDISKHGFAGQKWARNDYRASFPASLKTSPKTEGSPSAEPPLSPKEGGSFDDISPVVTRQGGSADGPPEEKGGSSVDQRRFISLPKAVQQMDSNMSINMSKEVAEGKTPSSSAPLSDSQKAIIEIQTIIEKVHQAVPSAKVITAAQLQLMNRSPNLNLQDLKQACEKFALDHHGQNYHQLRNPGSKLRRYVETQASFIKTTQTPSAPPSPGGMIQGIQAKIEKGIQLTVAEVWEWIYAKKEFPPKEARTEDIPDHIHVQMMDHLGLETA